MAVLDNVTSLLTIGIIGIGGYVIWKKFFSPDPQDRESPIIPDPPSGRCDTLQGLPRELCNLGGFILGDPFGCTQITPACIVNNINEGKGQTVEQCNWAESNEPALYQMMDCHGGFALW